MVLPWERNRARPSAPARTMDTIDAMLRELYQMRSRLVGEIRDSDDIRNARVDAMLAKTRS